LEKASSIGFKSGEYGGRNMIQTPKETMRGSVALEMITRTKSPCKLTDFCPMMNASIIHDKYTMLARICLALRKLDRESEYVHLGTRAGAHN
jgi:hypothetical protein